MSLYKLSGAREDMGGVMHEGIVVLDRKQVTFLETRGEVKRTIYNTFKRFILY